MIHYHGTPITPIAKLMELGGCSFCVPYADGRDVARCHEIGEGVMLDNGAFTFWRERTGGRIPSVKAVAAGAGDWTGFYRWVTPWLDYPTTWAVIPDIIDGTEADNDRLLVEWFTRRLPKGAPVWHMHEPLDRLRRLVAGYAKVCIGSSAQYAKLGTADWHRRMEAAMDVACKHETPWLHMLRGMAFAGSHYPFASVDSTSIAQNHAGNNTRNGAPKDVREMARALDTRQCAARWINPTMQLISTQGATPQ